jgi:hypothetical protein
MTFGINQPVALVGARLITIALVLRSVVDDDHLRLSVERVERGVEALGQDTGMTASSLKIGARRE